MEKPDLEVVRLIFDQISVIQDTNNYNNSTLTALPSNQTGHLHRTRVDNQGNHK